MEYVITLPWPHKDLSSNARVHWSRRSKASASQKTAAYWIARGKGIVYPMPDAALEFEFHPPDNRRRDAHNMPHMMKSAIDGIAFAMGCDDAGFRCTFPSAFSEARKGGAVVVTIKPATAVIPLRGAIS